MSREQLQALGFSNRQIASQARSGSLHECFTDVFAVGHRNISALGWLLAALLSCGPRSFLSHRTAAAVHGLRAINRRAIEVTIVAKRAPERSGLTVHRTAAEPDVNDVRTRGLLRFSSVPRMLVELAPRETRAELDRLITESVRRRIYNADAVEVALERYARRPGVAVLRTAVAAYRPRPDRRSDLERAFDTWLDAHPDIPDPLRNVHIDEWEIDCWWPDHNVALELDGRPYHVAVRDMERDRTKDIRLQLRGIRPMRVTDARFAHDRAGVYADLRAMLGIG